MTMQRKLILGFGIIFLLFLFAPLTIYAIESFDVDITPIVDRISVEDIAKYNVTITNRRPVEDIFRIYILAYPDWDLRTEPLSNPITIQVPAFSKMTLTVLLDSLHVTSIGNYQIDLNVRSLSTDTLVTKPLEVRIKSTEPLIEGYVPTVLLNLDMPKKIDPRQKLKMRITLANQNLLNYPEIMIIINSNLINEEIKEKLSPKEEKVIEVVNDLPEALPPQMDKIVITLIRGNRTIEKINLPIEVIEYKKLKSDFIYIKKFLKAEQHVKFTNVGNIISEEPLKVRSDLFKALFTVTKPKSRAIREGGVRFYVWEQPIQPYESFEVVIVENYRPLFLLLILGIVAIVVYYYYRAPVVFKKSAKNIIKSHGGISQFHVSLALKNRGNSPINDIEITDTIPDLVHIEKGILIGTLHPSKILRHESKGTIVKWAIQKLDAGEERVITYNTKSRLPILGGLTLPSAKTKFIYNGKSYSTASNKLDVKV